MSSRVAEPERIYRIRTKDIFYQRKHLSCPTCSTNLSLTINLHPRRNTWEAHVIKAYLFRLQWTVYTYSRIEHIGFFCSFASMRLEYNTYSVQRLCWALFMNSESVILQVIFDVLRLYGVTPIGNATYVARNVVKLLPYAHCCLNPIIYGFMSKNFRSSLRKACMIGSLCGSHHRQAASKLGTSTHFPPDSPPGLLLEQRYRRK